MTDKETPAGCIRRAEWADFSDDLQYLSVASIRGGSYHNPGPGASADNGGAGLAGGSFVLLPPGSKIPTGKGWNRPGAGVGLAEALSHVGRGGNASLLLGDGWIALDRDFAWLATLGLLGDYADTLRIIRDNAPDRGALVFRIIGDLPASTSWKPDGATPHLELLSSGRHKLIAGTYKGGNYRLENIDAGVKEITFDQLSHIWQIITGSPLRKPTPTKPKPTPKPIPEDGGLLSRLRAHWTAYAVFDHFGRITEDVLQGDWWKLRGNGGLFVGNPDGPISWSWHCFSDGVGGDAFDAWAYCTLGRVWDRNNKQEFKTILREMATAAGLDFDETDKPTRRIVTSDGEILDADGLAVAGRVLLTSRTKTTDRAAWVGVLEVMQNTGADECPISSRYLADLAGISHGTAARALKRLVEAGLLEYVKRPGNVLEAAVYRLTASIVHFETQGRMSPPPNGECVSIWTIGESAQTDTAKSLLLDAQLEDAWRYSRLVTVNQMGWATVAPTPAGTRLASLGHSGRELLATLDAYGAGNLSDLAEWAGMGRATVSRLADYLSDLGLVSLVRRGRAVVVSLVDDWREILSGLVSSMVTRGKCRGQRLKHAGQRIERAERFREKIAEKGGYIRSAVGRAAVSLAGGIIASAKKLQKALGGAVTAFVGGIRAKVHVIRFRNHPKENRSAILVNRRSERALGLAGRRAGLLETAKAAGGIFWPSEMAEFRNVSGRLGLDYRQSVKRVDLGAVA